MGNLTHRWLQSNIFPQKLGYFFDIPKRLGKTYPPPPPELIPRYLHNWVLKKIQDENVEVNLIRELFISGLLQKKPLGDK